MSILKYNSYVFAPTPVVVIDREPLGRDDGPQQAFRETWTVRGELLGDQAGLIAQKAALEQALAANGGDLVLYRDDGLTVMHGLINSQCSGGVHVRKRPTWPEGQGAVFATRLPYEFAACGVKMAADALAANAWGECTVSQSADSQGQARRTVQGWYAGGGAQAAADAAKVGSGVLVVSEEQSVSNAENKVSFRYEYVVVGSSRSVVSFVETVTKNTAFSSKVFRKTLGGDPPVRQTTVLNEVSATQQGEAVGLSGYPDFPDALWPEADFSASPVFIRESPRRTRDGQLTEYKIRWQYTFAWSVNPSVQLPHVPPA